MVRLSTSTDDWLDDDDDDDDAEDDRRDTYSPPPKPGPKKAEGMPPPRRFESDGGEKTTRGGPFGTTDSWLDYDQGGERAGPADRDPGRGWDGHEYNTLPLYYPPGTAPYDLPKRGGGTGRPVAQNEHESEYFSTLFDPGRRETPARRGLDVPQPPAVPGYSFEPQKRMRPPFAGVNEHESEYFSTLFDPGRIEPDGSPTPEGTRAQRGTNDPFRPAVPYWYFPETTTPEDFLPDPFPKPLGPDRVYVSPSELQFTEDPPLLAPAPPLSPDTGYWGGYHSYHPDYREEIRSDYRRRFDEWYSEQYADFFDNDGEPEGDPPDDSSPGETDGKGTGEQQRAQPDPTGPGSDPSPGTEGETPTVETTVSALIPPQNLGANATREQIISAYESDVSDRDPQIQYLQDEKRVGAYLIGQYEDLLGVPEARQRSEVELAYPGGEGGTARERLIDSLSELYADLSDLQDELEDLGMDWSTHPNAENVLSDAYRSFRLENAGSKRNNRNLKKSSFVDFGRTPLAPATVAAAAAGADNYNLRELSNAVSGNVSTRDSGYLQNYV